MGNSLRCCLACVLPCGSLDLIHIVHLNGHVEEISHPIMAREILKANPNHVLSKPCSEGVRRILILLPESELKRGTVYFLIPAASIPDKKRGSSVNNINKSAKTIKKCNSTSVSDCDRYFTNYITSKKKSKDHYRSQHVGIWRPNLQSISEE